MKSVKKINSQSDLYDEVDCLLRQIGEFHNSRGETYAETADRIEEDHPQAAQYLREAETRWFELND
jgi:hypothetical protein